MIFDKLFKAILTKARYTKINLHDDEFWEPFNYKEEPNSPGINEGDFICIEILDQTTDYIYQMVYKKMER